MRRARVVLFACALAAAASPAAAQPAGEACVQFVRQTSGNSFAAGDPIVVRGPAGCADPQVAVEVMLGRRLLSRFTSRADGSYQSPKAFLPNDASSGPDVVRTVTTRVRAQAEYVHAVAVTAAAANQAALPTPEARGERNVLLLAIWATVLVIVAAGIVIARRRDVRARAGRGAEAAGPLPSADPEATGFFDLEAEFGRELETDEPAIQEEPGESQDGWQLELPAEPVHAAPIRTPDHASFDRPSAPVHDGSATFAALVEDEPIEAATDEGASETDHETDQEIDAVLKRASDESTDVIDRLRDEIASWTRTPDGP